MVRIPGCQRRHDPFVRRNEEESLRTQAPDPPVAASPVERRWDRLAWLLILAAQEGARAFMVLRARRIWGLLGNKLRRSPWCRAWRSINAIPTVALRWVKVWRVTGR